LRGWLEQRFGLDLAAFGASALAEAVQARVRATGSERTEDYLGRWRGDENERQALLEQFLVGETWFFREWAAFEFLGEQARALAGRFRAGNPLRILCLPCASGEEAWSIAITLHEAGLNAASASIDAVDLSHGAIREARRGVYEMRKLRGQPLARWADYLQAEGPERFRVADVLRDMVAFFQGNALDSKFLRSRGTYDMVFCRNMMIYMSNQARSRLCRLLAGLLAPGGLLFLGHAETLPADAGFSRHGGFGAFAWRRDSEQAGQESNAVELRNPFPMGHSVCISPLPIAGSVEKASKAGWAEERSPTVMSKIDTPAQEDRRRSGLSPTYGHFMATCHLRYPLAGEASGRDSKADGGTIPAGPAQPPSAPAAPPPSALETARTLADRGAYGESLELLEREQARRPLDPDLHALLGVLCDVLGRHDKAVTHFRRALYLDPTHPESLAHLALLLERRGNPVEAGRLRQRLRRE
jgi:chemotaxis protein methyltransferase WspC